MVERKCKINFDGSAHDCSNSIADALELPQSYPKPSILYLIKQKRVNHVCIYRYGTTESRGPAGGRGVRAKSQEGSIQTFRVAAAREGCVYDNSQWIRHPWYSVVRVSCVPVRQGGLLYPVYFWLSCFNTLRSKQNCRHFTDDVVQCFLLNGPGVFNCILIKISTKICFKESSW